jgi:hypothetical protein
MAQMSKKLHTGVRSKCSVLVCFLHPSKEASERIANPINSQRVTNLLLVKTEVIQVNKTDQACYVFCHSDFENTLLHTPMRWARIEVEGPENRLFDSSQGSNNKTNNVSLRLGSNSSPDEEIADVLSDIPITREIRNDRNTVEDIAMLQGMGLNVNGDNKLIEENIPERNADETEYDSENLKLGQSWGWNGFCERENKMSVMSPQG